MLLVYLKQNMLYKFIGKLVQLRGNGKKITTWRCPFYTRWVGMLERGYSLKFKDKAPTYKDCTVCEEWLTFSSFKAWMEQQDWEGKQLDKDLLVRGNKLYSPETCVFISRQVNNFLIERDFDRGDYLIGVSWYKAYSKFMANCSNPFTKKRENLGYFSTEAQAHEAWLSRKLEFAYQLAAIQVDERVSSALISRYENYQKGGL